ncbi:MAG: hypothetical protein BWY78_00990 [Alphaproteobacteria bacterium ADurb.Bin438]|nr:MAG: hypothetical protein BWY78_00990 [Alphaproteobacteria bacterium ADurb.Bin438]
MSEEERVQLQKTVVELIEAKDEISKELDKLINEELPKRKDEINEKLFGSFKSEKRLEEEKFISEYSKNKYLNARMISCLSNVDDGVSSALIEIIPYVSIEPVVKFNELELKLKHNDNIKNHQIYSLLPYDDGYFYNKTYGVLLYSVKDKFNDVEIDLDASYRACLISDDKVCEKYNDNFKVKVLKFNKDEKPLKISDCGYIKDIIASIPDEKYSSIKIKDFKYDGINKVLDIKAIFQQKPYFPYAYYYDFGADKNVYAVTNVNENEVDFKFAYENDGKGVKIIIKDGQKGLIKNLTDIKSYDYNKKGLYYLARTLEKGFLINFISPSLLLLIGFFISFSGFGEGKVVNVKKRAKEILIAIFLVFVLFGILLMFSYKLFPHIIYGVQFLYPFINVIIIGLCIFLFCKVKDNFFIKALLVIPLFVISPFTGAEGVFNQIYPLGPVFCLSFALVLGLGFALPYILFLIIPEYVVALSYINGNIYKFKDLKWLPIIILSCWYLVVCVVDVLSLNKMIGEPFSIEKFYQLKKENKVFYLSMDANYNLSSNISRFSIRNIPVFEGRNVNILRMDYHDAKNYFYIKSFGINNIDNSLLFGPKARGGFFIKDTILAEDSLNFYKKVN